MKTAKYKFTPFQKAWIDALIAQTYKQAKERLCIKNPDDNSLSYCCLGVACEIAPKFGIELEVETDRNYLVFNGQWAYLPVSVAEKLKLKDTHGKISEGLNLAYKNDREGLTHKEIGEFIRDNPEKVFVS